MGMSVPAGTRFPCSLEDISGSLGEIKDYVVWKTNETIKMQRGITTPTALGNHTYMGMEWIFYIDAMTEPSLDFQASSPAISTTCTPMTKQCTQGLTQNPSDFVFSCSDGLKVNLTDSVLYVPGGLQKIGGDIADATAATPNSQFGISFGADPRLTRMAQEPSDMSILMPWPTIIPQNPSYFGTWGINYPTVAGSTESLDGVYLNMLTRSNVWFLNCTTQVAHLKYTRVNGSIAKFELRHASGDMAGLLAGQFSFAQVSSSVQQAMANINTAASVSNSMTELSDTWATEFSKNALMLAIGVMIPLQNELEQQRNSTVVLAQVPLIPLYLLIGLKFIYVVAVLVLGIGAYAFTHPAEIEVVKAQLSAKGLAAAHFDQPALLQQNVAKQVENRLALARTGKT